MGKSRNYLSDLMESLKDPDEAAEYLNAALEDGEPEVFLLALRDVVESHGGMSKLAACTSLNRENLYRMLSSKGNPEFFSLSTVLSAVGFRLAVEPKSAAAQKIILHTYVNQVRESMPEYALAADTDSDNKTEMLVRTQDNKEVGILDFDFTDSSLVLRITTDILIEEVKEAEIRSNDGQVLMGEISTHGKDRLVLLKKKKLFPKDVSQITLTMAHK